MALPTEHTEDWGFNALGPEQGVSAVEPYETLPDVPVHLLAVAPESGVFAAAGGSSIVVGDLAEVRAALEADKPVEPRHKVKHESPLHLAFSASEKQLFVYDAEQRVSVYNTQDWSLEFTSEPLKAQVTNLKAFRSKQGLVLASQEGIMVIDSEGELSTASSDTVFTLGSNDEIITPSHPDLDISSLPTVGRLLALQALAPGWVFLVAESAEGDAEYVTYMRHENEWLEVENTLMTPDTDGPLTWHQGVVHQWPSVSSAFTSVAVSSHSSELLLMSPSAVWKPMNETDNLPFTTEDEDIIAVGGALDLSDKTPRESLSGVEGRFPFPLWLVLTQEGRILGWNIVCRDASKDNITWEVPSSVEVPDLRKISTAGTSKDIADEELDEISESDAHDNAQLNTTKAQDEVVPVVSESKQSDDDISGTEEGQNEDLGSSAEETPEEESVKLGSGSDEPPAGGPLASDASESNDDTTKALPKATFGSTWDSKPGFASWAKSGDNENPFSKFTTPGDKRGSSPFGSGLFGGSNKVETSLFGANKSRSSSPFSGLGSPSASASPQGKPPSIFGHHQNPDSTTASTDSTQPGTKPANPPETPKSFPHVERKAEEKVQDDADSSNHSQIKSQSEPSNATDNDADAQAKHQADAEAQREAQREAELAAQHEKAKAEAEAEAERKAKAEAEARSNAEAEQKARADAEFRAEAERKAHELAAKVESTTWLGDRKTSLISPNEALKTASLDGLSDMDAIYAQTNALFQLLDHNLSALEHSDVYEKHSQVGAFEKFNEWGVGDSSALRHEAETLLAGRAHEVNLSMTSLLRKVSELSAQASDALADLAILETTVAELNVETGDTAYKLRPLPARSSYYRRELQAKLGKISRLISEEKEAVLLRRTELGENIGYSNILAAIESIDSRLHAIKEYVKPPANHFPGRTNSIAPNSAHAAESYPDYSRGFTRGDVGDAVPTSASNVPSQIRTVIGSGHPAFRREQLIMTEALLNSLKARDAASCITSTSL